MSYEKAEVPAMPWTGGPLPRPELLTVAPSPISLLSAFRRRWVLATFLGVLMGGLLALGPYFAVPVRYTVGTLLKVAEVEPYILAGKRGGPDEFDRYKSAEAQRILAIDVMTYALRDSNVNSLPILPKANPVEFLQKNISVSYPGNSTLMRISMKGKDPEQLKVIVNAVREAYLTQVIEDRRQKKLDDLANKEKYLKDLSDEADRQRDMIHNLLTNLQSTPQLLVQQAKMYAEKLSSLHREQMGKRETIRKLGHEVAMATAALEEAEKQDPTVLEDVVEQALMQQDPEFATIREEWIGLVKRLRLEQDKARNPNNASINHLKDKIADLEEEMSERRVTVRADLAEGFKEQNISDAKQALAEAKSSFELTNKDFEDIGAEIKTMLEKTQIADQGNSKIIGKQKLLKEKETVAEELRREVELLTLETNSPARVKKPTPAETEGNDRTMKYSIVGFSGLLGLLSAVFGVSFMEFQKRRIGSTSDVSEGLGVNVIGALPSLSGNTWSKMVSRNRNVRGLLTDSVDSVRSALLYGEGKNGRKVIMVTSATPGEGKTTVATQLAASLARAGRRTLLVDADLRSPKAHRVFELPLEPGMSEVLRNEAEIDDVIRPTRAPGLWMITAGGCCQECIQALARDDIRVMLAKLRDEFDFVILDSGPVLSTADSLSLGVHADVAVLSILKDTSQATKVYEAFERLDAVGVYVLGAVVNGVNAVVKRNVTTLPVRASA